MQKQNFSQGGFMPQNRQHHRKAKYPNKVAKPKSLAFVRIFLFRSAGSRNAYFPTAPFSSLSGLQFPWTDDILPRSILVKYPGTPPD